MTFVDYTKFNPDGSGIPDWDILPESTVPDWDYLPPTDNTSENPDPYGPGSKWGQDTLSAMGISNDTNPSGSSSFNLGNFLKSFGGKALDFAQTPQGIMALLAALASYKDRARPSGGGTAMAYAGPKQMTRTMTQGAYGPIARYAANGGVMHAYANGGVVQMEDGGFVMTKKAVDGAGGMQGMQQKLPEAVPIRGPGHGTSDSIPAVIQGPNGVTPAKVSNGEMYVPPGRDTRGLYALMRAMERKA